MTTEAVIQTGRVSSSGIPMAIFGWPADLAGCGTYRIINPLKALAQRHGVQVEIGAQSTLPFTILVAQRSHRKEPVGVIEHIKASQVDMNGIKIPKIVYEIDDDLWSVPEHNPSHSYFMSQGNLPRAGYAASLADMVTVSTEPLAEVMRKYNDNVVVLPNSVPDRLLNEQAFPYTTELGKPYIIGWAGSSTHEKDFRQAASGINTILKLMPNSRMVFIGTDYSRLLDPSVLSQVRVAGWTKTVRDFHDLLGKARIDVMLAPLEPSKFNESKSNLRIIEANALGIPVVATDFGPYSFVQDGIHGLKVGVGESWTTAINELNNPLKRLEISAKARSWAAGFAQSATVDLWVDAYDSLLSS